jgi:hypothetical protein
LATFFSSQGLNIWLKFSAADLLVPAKRWLYMLGVMRRWRVLIPAKSPLCCM